MPDYQLSITVTVDGKTETHAAELVRQAGMSLQSWPGIEHASMSTPRLFEPVDVMRGQVALETDR